MGGLSYVCVHLPATMSSDYIRPTSSHHMFASGSSDGTTECVNIMIVDDDALEGNQTFTVSLRTADTNDEVMVVANLTRITIIDDDSKLTLHI